MDSIDWFLKVKVCVLCDPERVCDGYQKLCLLCPFMDHDEVNISLLSPVMKVLSEGHELLYHVIGRPLALLDSVFSEAVLIPLNWFWFLTGVSQIIWSKSVTEFIVHTVIYAISSPLLNLITWLYDHILMAINIYEWFRSSTSIRKFIRLEPFCDVEFWNKQTIKPINNTLPKALKMKLSEGEQRKKILSRKIPSLVAGRFWDPKLSNFLDVIGKHFSKARHEEEEVNDAFIIYHSLCF